MTKELTIEETDKVRGKPWPCHSSQTGLIKELCQAGITVGLTYLVTPIEPEQSASSLDKE